MSRLHKKGAHPNAVQFDKYDYYRRSVQSPESDVLFYRKTFKELTGRTPQIFREDFCGTHALSCEWVKLDKKFKAIGIDLDPEPINYGKQNYQSKLATEQTSRIEIMQKDVLSKDLPKADLVLAANFSYFVFKTRERMKTYFASVKSSLNPRSLFIMDTFGGSLCYDANEESTRHKDFTYFWDQESFDPITNRAHFHIHFKPHGKKKIERVFSYDWRMWSVPELKEILEEVGFKKIHIYWEGTTRAGGGNGVFKSTSIGEACQSWIAYIVAEN